MSIWPHIPGHLPRNPPRSLPFVFDQLCYDIGSRSRCRTSSCAGSAPVGDHARDDCDRSSRFKSMFGRRWVQPTASARKANIQQQQWVTLGVAMHSRRERCRSRLTVRLTRSTHAECPIPLIQPCLPQSTSSETESPIHCLNRPRPSSCASSRTRAGNTDSVIVRPPNHQSHS